MQLGEAMNEPVSSDSLSIRDERVCEKCRNGLQHVDCWSCGGEGFSDHDCGEDCCACLMPEDNVECDVCDGTGGWWACSNCNPGAFDDF